MKPVGYRVHRLSEAHSGLFMRLSALDARSFTVSFLWIGSCFCKTGPMLFTALAVRSVILMLGRCATFRRPSPPTDAELGLASGLDKGFAPSSA